MNVLLNRLLTRTAQLPIYKQSLKTTRSYKEPTVLQRSLRTVIEAQGGVLELAKQIDIDSKTLSRMISNDDTPLIDAVGTVLEALGYQFSIEPINLENRNIDTYIDTLDEQKTSTYVAEN